MNHVVKAKMLRESDEPIHYNCAQSLFVAFSDVLGVSDERAFAMGANYGGGMMHGGTCGVVSAGLMILSLAGIPQEKAMALLQDFSRDHGTTACTELLMKAAQEGVTKKVNCDGLVIPHGRAAGRHPFRLKPHPAHKKQPFQGCFFHAFILFPGSRGRGLLSVQTLYP